MIDIQKICRDACDGVPLSLRDDPTTWSDAPDMQEVRDCVEQATEDNVKSALAKALGAVCEEMATAMDAEIAENGPLADLETVWNGYTTGYTGNPNLDLVAQAADWEARVDALRSIMVEMVNLWTKHFTEEHASMTDGQIANVIIADTRLAHLKDQPFTPPAFLGLDPADAPEAEQQIVWDDEPEIESESATLVGGQLTDAESFDWEAEDGGTVTGRWGPNSGHIQTTVEEPVKPVRGRGKRIGASVPKFAVLMQAAGFQDQEASEIIGVTKAYYSMMRSGKRPWQGLRDEAIERLRTEIAGRQDALQQALASLDEPAVRNADTP